MKVDAVQSNNNNRHTVLLPLSKGAAIGVAAGYVGKYLIPLTTEEKNSDEYIKIFNKVQDQKNTFNFRTQKYLDYLKGKEKQSLAEDEFVRMFDGLKDGEKVKPSSIRKAIGNIEQKNPNELLEFKRICKNSSAVAEKSAKQFMNAYDLMTKHIRPTAFFIATGAILGAFVALMNDILKVRVNN